MMNDKETQHGRGCLVGLTGGIACGKSEVGRLLQEFGAEVLDTDIVAHELISPGGAAYRKVLERFGPVIRDSDGTINRRRLGERIFSDPTERAALNALVHPAVRATWKKWAAKWSAEGRVAVCIVPLLYEVGLQDEFDVVVCVQASDAKVRERLAGRGLSPEAAQQRLDAQWPVEEKARRADYVIVNTGSLEELKRQTRDIWNRILSK